jgi:hypothetical protein
MINHEDLRERGRATGRRGGRVKLKVVLNQARESAAQKVENQGLFKIIDNVYN